MQANIWNKQMENDRYFGISKFHIYWRNERWVILILFCKLIFFYLLSYLNSKYMINYKIDDSGILIFPNWKIFGIFLINDFYTFRNWKYLNFRNCKFFKFFILYDKLWNWKLIQFWFFQTVKFLKYVFFFEF